MELVEKKIVSAHKLNGGRPIVRGVGVGKGLRLSVQVDEVGLSLPRGGDGWVGWEQLGGFGGPVLPVILSTFGHCF